MSPVLSWLFLALLLAAIANYVIEQIEDARTHRED